MRLVLVDSLCAVFAASLLFLFLFSPALCGALLPLTRTAAAARALLARLAASDSTQIGFCLTNTTNGSRTNTPNCYFVSSRSLGRHHIVVHIHSAYVIRCVTSKESKTRRRKNDVKRCLMTSHGSEDPINSAETIAFWYSQALHFVECKRNANANFWSTAGNGWQLWLNWISSASHLVAKNGFWAEYVALTNEKFSYVNKFAFSAVSEHDGSRAHGRTIHQVFSLTAGQWQLRILFTFLVVKHVRTLRFLQSFLHRKSGKWGAKFPRGSIWALGTRSSSRRSDTNCSYSIRSTLRRRQLTFLLLTIRIKDKINNPPEKKDFQKVSHSMARFIKLKEQAAEAAKSKIKPKTPAKKVDNEDKPGKVPSRLISFSLAKLPPFQKTTRSSRRQTPSSRHRETTRNSIRFSSAKTSPTMRICGEWTE